ncbi:MAG: choice-of-anchor D domain-containing protein [Deltaproteobacteria bacterium]|nr:choice-of-anchor D domain-containing protein [Deltaproteobacteria bacterium]
MRRVVAAAAVLGAAVIAAAAVGNGKVVATTPVLVVSGSQGTDTLQNTTSSSITTAVTQDPSCAPGATFQIAGGMNPFTIGASGTKQLTVGCPSGTPGLARCLYHAIDSTNGAALSDFLQVCVAGTSSTLQPSAPTLDFGSAVAVGATATLPLVLHNAGAGTVERVFLQTTDPSGDFGFALPCNLVGASFCDASIAPLATGSDTTIQVTCTPQSPGMHTANLVIASDSSQLLSQAVQLRCGALAATGPVLAVEPASIVVASSVEVGSGAATATLHLSNAGTGTLLVTDVRAVDVDTGAAIDWSYVAHGHCTGQIPPTCQLDAGDQVDLDVTFNPSQIAARHASLLVTYKDTQQRSRAIPLEGAGSGATLALAGSAAATLDFGVVPTNHTSALDVYVVNHGTRDTTAMLSAMPAGPPFALMPATSATVPPVGSTKITATCSPIAAGTFQTTFTFDAPDAFASAPIVLAATCEGSTQPLFAMPTALSFGEVRTTAGSVTKTVMLQSATGAPLTLTGQPTLETTNSSITLGPLSSTMTPATFDVTIDSSIEGDLTNRISIGTSDQTIKIPLTGRIVKPAYAVDSTLDIGTFCINQPTTQSNVALQSTGTATIRLQHPQLQANGSPFDLSPTTPLLYPADLSPGQSAVVALTPHPQQQRMTVSDTLTWTTDVEGAPTAMTQITAHFIDSGGAIAPPALDFGKVVVHISEDNGQRVVIQNCNANALMLDAPTIKAPFSIDSPTIPAQLNPNETATFSIGFHPTRLGTFTGTLLISSPQLTSPLSVSLSGEAVAGNPTPDAGSAMPPGPGESGCCETSHVGGTPLLVILVAFVLRRRRVRYAGGE